MYLYPAVDFESMLYSLYEKEEGLINACKLEGVLEIN